MNLNRHVTRQVKAMTRIEVITKAIEGKIRWLDVGAILGITDRQVRRLKQRAERNGVAFVVDQRGGRPRRKRIPAKTIEALCGLRRGQYMDFTVRHFWEHATEKHGLKISYSHALAVLQAGGLAEKLPRRGTYRRRRERRPMRGMMLHIDASTHAWFEGMPNCDLIVVLDDADGSMLYAKFFPQEGVASTLDAIRHVVTTHGRFGELYHDRGTHYGQREGLDAADPSGQVQRVLRALGTRQIFARSPEARGRSERCFSTLQHRLVAELKLHGIGDMEQGNRYLATQFINDFNQRFTVKPTQPDSAFVPLVGIDLQLLMAIQHERTVGRDNTVRFHGHILQLPEDRKQRTFAACPVIVHELGDTLVVTWQGCPIGRFSSLGDPLPTISSRRKTA